jgi:uncharacterized protein (UPF0548 family)
LILLRRPDEKLIRRTIQRQRDEPVTYAAIGATRDSVCPPGFMVNHSQALLGHGHDTFQRAKDAMRDYRMLNLGWLRAVPESPGISEGMLVAVMICVWPIHTLNIARIMYVETESNRFGFGYGTTADYPVCGEERFSVIFDPATDEVRFEIFSFSKPSSISTRLGWPVVRQVQRRFCRDSMQAMKRAVLGP